MTPYGQKETKSNDPSEQADEEIDRLAERFVGWLNSKNTGPHEWMVALATVVLMFVGCVQLVVSCSNSAQTSQLIDAANRNASAADSFSTSSSKINQGISDAVTKLNLQADSLSNSVTQATRLADATEKSNRNVLEADRPWMGISLSVDNLEVGKIPQMRFGFQNSGRRPARISEGAAVPTLSQVFTETPDFGTQDPKSKGIVLPGGGTSAGHAVFQHPLTQQTLNELNNGSIILAIYSKVEYADVRTGETHWTHRCLRYSRPDEGNESKFVDCGTYNGTDDK
jgi:hypothetical protein